MKITHIIPSLKGGGIQNFVFSLIPEQVKLGHIVSVIVTDEDNIDYSNNKKKDLEAIGVNVYNLNRKISDKWSFFTTFIKCRSALSKLRPDIVNSHGLYCHKAAAYATWLTTAKHCCTIHNAPEPWDKLTHAMNKNTPLIFCSDAALQLKAQKSRTMIAINNGADIASIRVIQKVDLHQELSIPQDEKIVVLVGSPRPQKNYPFLIETIKALKNDRIHFCICGGQYKVGRKGSNDTQYINLEPLTHYPNIHLLGLRNDIPAILNDADAYLSCSLKEGLPISALEAFFSGIPCVLSPIMQHTMIAEGIDSCFIPKKFEPIDFVDAINRALGCTDSHDLIYGRRKENLKKFSMDRCAAEYVNFYKQLLNEK